MFSSIGWPEIITLLVLGLIIIGPERLPKVIEDVRAAAYAAKKAIHNAKAELNGDFGADFEELREPINKLASIQRMGPKAALTKALFDGDQEFMDTFDPKKIMEDDTAGQAYREQQAGVEKPHTPPAPEIQKPQPKQGFSWDDIT
ncbi:Sec-independent protein translocase subunit TatB [Corynebacterium silvaticum]|uniref:Sec-independent protein translocase subunit TatB n=1 Tax=Corynebacterium silvaticum TaxID=2320431 RepID=A0ACD4Q0Y8_9CORY|nr:Sec-independent protein translocase subunit TatB [Corynebacterium silvaticum]MBH5300486.1 Sec-independent protein translocase subunit TatB [Corynebacterium silvaticum]NOM64685.1 Sec-independent protein translocase subunit TatB [Corynebacterium silvaticum]NON69830.1 Sec-independent protein translocase subunit TatB [Corynebacterium silvaticum]TFA93326.1 Sec-independent protein translocase subunit TatB [Corynebacterium silvaticum]TFA96656.1 Sec-independent protein translocase subunit TatB [Cor